eukprot:3542160-Pyramimonas_sp.AAC.1
MLGPLGPISVASSGHLGAVWGLPGPSWTGYGAYWSISGAMVGPCGDVEIACRRKRSAGKH